MLNAIACCNSTCTCSDNMTGLSRLHDLAACQRARAPRERLQAHDNQCDAPHASALGRQVRVMPRCWFALLRFWLRVDGVLVRLYEARWLAELGGGAVRVQRELRRCEGAFADLAAAGAPPARVRAAFLHSRPFRNGSL